MVCSRRINEGLYYKELLNMLIKNAGNLEISLFISHCRVTWMPKHNDQLKCSYFHLELWLWPKGTASLYEDAAGT